LKKNKNFKIVKWLGVYVLVSVLLNVAENIYSYGDFAEILWFCDYIAVFLAVGLLINNKDLVSTVLVLAFPAQFWWIIDFFLEFAGLGLGRTASLMNFSWLDFILSVNLHAVLIPISAYGVYKLGFSNRSLVLAWLMVLTLLPMTFIMTDIDDNINCVFFGCDAVHDGDFEKKHFLQYFLVQSLLFWLVIFIPSFFLFKWLYRSRS